MFSILYNYVFGYIKVKCYNCDNMVYIKYDINTKGTLISCSNSCTYKNDKLII